MFWYTKLCFHSQKMFKILKSGYFKLKCYKNTIFNCKINDFNTFLYTKLYIKLKTIYPILKIGYITLKSDNITYVILIYFLGLVWCQLHQCSKSALPLPIIFRYNAFGEKRTREQGRGVWKATESWPWCKSKFTIFIYKNVWYIICRVLEYWDNRVIG